MKKKNKKGKPLFIICGICTRKKSEHCVHCHRAKSPIEFEQGEYRKEPGC